MEGRRGEEKTHGYEPFQLTHLPDGYTLFVHLKLLRGCNTMAEGSRVIRSSPLRCDPPAHRRGRRHRPTTVVDAAAAAAT